MGLSSETINIRNMYQKRNKRPCISKWWRFIQSNGGAQSSQPKPHPNCSLGVGWFGVKTMPPKVTRSLNGAINLVLVWSLGSDKEKSSDPIGSNLESSIQPSIWPQVWTGPYLCRLLLIYHYLIRLTIRWVDDEKYIFI